MTTYADLAPEAHETILRALGWTPKWSQGQPHTLDDLIAWHRLANGARNPDVPPAVEAAVEAIVKRYAELRAVITDEEFTRLRLHHTIGRASIDRADDEGAVGVDVLRMPYTYDDNNRYHAYLRRFLQGVTRDVPYGFRDKRSRESITIVGDENPDLLDLCYELNVQPLCVLDPHPEGTSVEWRIRATSHASYLHEDMLADQEAAQLEPTGIYLTHLGENVFFFQQPAALRDYKECRKAGMTHGTAAELVALNIENIREVIELCREVGEEYGLAAAKGRT